MSPFPSLDGPPASRFNAARTLLALILSVTAATFLTLAPLTPAKADTLRLLAFGDSLVAGYGLADRESFTVQLEAALLARGVDIQVINGGVSGDTSAGGLARLEWALGDQPDLVLLELGANDGLRGIDPAATKENLADILRELEAREIPVLLAGMYAPPNLGEDYAERFDAIYPALSDEFEIPLYPFFLEGVATDPELNQQDGMHPNAQGVARIVEQIVPYIVDLIEAEGLATSS
ncbi:arylesterase [Inquilinus sp. CAU 1745]|uniref:arylesterase n=1 Tax=Inquilinus sp. CAU 1745 TaxID=3140369 RepID=UPI00325B14FE